VPAGYLPAPKQARFISEAEQAAQKLPATIKAQSLKNALLKGGAKPLELEYAGMDDFIQQNQGKPVSAADVLAHLKTEGPLGKLKRVEQQVADGQAFGGMTDDDPYSNPNYDESVQLLAPEYTSDVRKPFDTQTASNQTGYHRYTVPGKRNDFNGYREILLEDPRNALHDQDRMIIPENGPDPVDAHAADYFARFNEYPDRIALQNIQSDLGQDYTKSGPKTPDEVEDTDADLDILNQQMDDLNERLRQSTDPDERYGIAEDIEELQERGSQHYLLNYTPEGDAYFESRGGAPMSPISKDDNWKNLGLRHIALQSIQGGGKPITIPSGRDMVFVEQFGGHKHNIETPEGHAAAAKSAQTYNADLVRRLQKIFRGLHPDGASVTVHRQPEPMRTSLNDFGVAEERKARIAPGISALDQILMNRGRDGVDIERLREADGRASELLQIATSDHERRNTPETLARMQEAITEANRAFQELMKFSNPTLARHAGLERSPAIDRSIWESLNSGSDGPTLEGHIAGAMPDQNNLSSEFRNEAMKVIQHDRLMQEMGQPGLSEQANVSLDADLDAPGWTVKPSPMAVRQGLEKGLPIMSLAPLLLQPQGERK
jgi:hypothetical protein